GIAGGSRRLSRLAGGQLRPDAGLALLPHREAHDAHPHGDRLRTLLGDAGGHFGVQFSQRLRGADEAYPLATAVEFLVSEKELGTGPVRRPHSLGELASQIAVDGVDRSEHLSLTAGLEEGVDIAGLEEGVDENADGRVLTGPAALLEEGL